MTRIPALLVAALLAPFALAQSAPADEPQVTDPTGDARWWTTSDATASASLACSAGGRVSLRSCETARGVAGEPPNVGGAPAPAALDIVHARFVPNATHVLVELGIASISAEFPMLALPAEMVYYTVCLSDDEPAACSNYIGFGILRVNGTLQFDPYIFRKDEICAAAGGCYFGAVAEIVPGTPGSIRWSLPRAALDPTMTTLVAPYATAVYASLGQAPSGSQYEARAASVRAGGAMSPQAYTTADFAGPGRDVPLGRPSRAWSPDLDTVETWVDSDADNPTGRDDLEILDVSWIEEERAVTIAARVARVDEVPLDHHASLAIVSATGGSVMAGYEARDGVRSAFSGACSGQGVCALRPQSSLSKPAEVRVTAGSPGWINVTISRVDLAEPRRGDPIPYTHVRLLPPAAAGSHQAEAARFEHVEYWEGDFVWATPPWWFRLGPEAIVDEQNPYAIVVEDDAGDANPPLDVVALASSLDSFDITFLKIEATSADELRIELGLQDLSAVETPAGYSAVLYAAALSSEKGAYMVGYYDGDGRKAFFCAPDTAVLARPPTDPNKVVWQPIQGLLSIVRERGQTASGGSSPGSIVFLAPYSCFNAQPGVALQAETVAAGTFLIQRTGEPLVVDEAQSESPVAIAAARVTPPPFWAKPFGIDEFWNIAGIVGAILVSGFGAITLKRKRGALRRYLDDIEETSRRHAADARSREKALLALHARLHADLLKNRINESHYVIVERRLELRLAKARVQELADAFGDVPHRILLKLQELLADGQMDPEDWRLFRTQLDAESYLPPERRAAIERRVQAWVREHEAD